MRRIIIILFLFLVASCGLYNQLPSTNEQTEKQVEVKELITYIHDTVEVQVPQSKEKVIVKDSTSHLENDVAISDAKIDSTGLLHHSLETKPTPIKVQVVYKEVVRDSIVYVNKIKEVRIPVVKEKPLSWWQQTQIKGFYALLVVCSILILINKVSQPFAFIKNIFNKLK